MYEHLYNQKSYWDLLPNEIQEYIIEIRDEKIQTEILEYISLDNLVKRLLKEDLKDIQYVFNKNCKDNIFIFNSFDKFEINDIIKAGNNVALLSNYSKIKDKITYDPFFNMSQLKINTIDLKQLI